MLLLEMTVKVFLVLEALATMLDGAVEGPSVRFLMSAALRCNSQQSSRSASTIFKDVLL
jgi:hypothetical protein